MSSENFFHCGHVQELISGILLTLLQYLKLLTSIHKWNPCRFPAFLVTFRSISNIKIGVDFFIIFTLRYSIISFVYENFVPVFIIKQSKRNVAHADVMLKTPYFAVELLMSPIYSLVKCKKK